MENQAKLNKKYMPVLEFAIVGGGHGGAPFHPMIFFETLPIIASAPPMGQPPSKNKTPFQKMIHRKLTKIGNCH